MSAKLKIQLARKLKNQKLGKMELEIMLLVMPMSALFNDFVFCRMLKNRACSLYDAEFSRITYKKRLTSNIVASLTSIGLRLCLTNYTKHPVCKSVNYNRPQKLCEMSSASLNWDRGVGAQRESLINATNWNHFDTRNRNTVNYFLL